jgi:hypothetical protein
MCGTYENKGASSSPRRNRGEDGCKKHGDDETKTAYHRRQARLSAFSYAGSRFDDYHALKKTSTRCMHTCLAYYLQAVTGEVPNSAPIDIQKASVQYASVDRGKSPVSGSTTPEKRAILYSVAVQSMISTYRKVMSAMAKCPGFSVMFQSSTLSV